MKKNAANYFIKRGKQHLIINQVYGDTDMSNKTLILEKINNARNDELTKSSTGEKTKLFIPTVNTRTSLKNFKQTITRIKPFLDVEK